MRLRVFLRGIRWEKWHQNRQLKWSPCERNLGSELDFPSTQGPFLGYFKGKIEVQDLFFSGWRHRRVERFSFLRVSRDFLRVFLRGKRRPRVFLRVIPWEKRHQNRQWSSGVFFLPFSFSVSFFFGAVVFCFFTGFFFFFTLVTGLATEWVSGFYAPEIRATTTAATTTTTATSSIKP